MITVRLDDSSLACFDGTVVEHFYGAKSQRAHVGLIREIQFDTDRNGRITSCQIKSNTMGNYQSGVNTMYLLNNNIVPYSDGVIAQMKALAAEIEKARAAFQAG